MDLAARSVLRSASTLPMSGLAAPSRTTMPISDRASSILLSARTNPRLPSSSAAAAIQDHDVGALAARQPRRDRFRRIAHRGTARRDQMVAARALEGRPELGISAVKAGRDHDLDIGGACRLHDQQGRDGDHQSRARDEGTLQLHLPGLADQALAETAMRLACHQHKSGILIDLARGGQNALGP